MAKKKTLWLLVSNDKYRLPLFVADSPIELARHCGVSPSTIESAASRYHSGAVNSSQYERVELDADIAAELVAELAEMDKEYYATDGKNT